MSVFITSNSIVPSCDDEVQGMSRAESFVLDMMRRIKTLKDIQEFKSSTIISNIDMKNKIPNYRQVTWRVHYWFKKSGKFFTELIDRSLFLVDGGGWYITSMLKRSKRFKW